MSDALPELDELLTGLIDGQLSASERQELERRMVDDAALRQRLASLQANQVALRALESPVPSRSASAIVARAIELAAQQVVRPHWIPNATHVGLAYKRPWYKSPQRLGLVATAASLVLVLLAIQLKGPTAPVAREPDQLVQLGEQPSANKTLNADNLQQPSVGDGLLADNSVVPLPLSEQEIAGSVTVARDLQSNNSSVRDVPADAARDNGVADSLAQADVSSEMPMEMQSLDDLSTGVLLTVVDISISEEVPAMEELERILRRYDIAFGEKLHVDATTVSSLEQKRLVEGAVKDARLADQQGDTGLIFVKSRAVRLDAAILAIMADIEAFPGFSMDVLMDPPSLELFQQLRKVQTAALPSNGGETSTVSIASPLYANNEQHARWLGARAARPSVPTEVRLQTKVPEVSTLPPEQADPVSYALIVVRNLPKDVSLEAR